MKKLNEEETVKNIFIEEETYQKIKDKIGKKDDYFTKKEMLRFNAIFNATPKKSYKK